MKAIGLKIANLLSLVWRLLPERLRHLLLKGLFVLESRGADTGAGYRHRPDYSGAFSENYDEDRVGG